MNRVVKVVVAQVEVVCVVFAESCRTNGCRYRVVRGLAFGSRVSLHVVHVVVVDVGVADDDL